MFETVALVVSRFRPSKTNGCISHAGCRHAYTYGLRHSSSVVGYHIKINRSTGGIRVEDTRSHPPCAFTRAIFIFSSPSGVVESLIRSIIDLLSISMRQETLRFSRTIPIFLIS